MLPPTDNGEGNRRAGNGPGAQILIHLTAAAEGAFTSPLLGLTIPVPQRLRTGATRGCQDGLTAETNSS